MSIRWLANLKREATFWLARRLPPCTEVTELISESMDRRISLRERVELYLHLRICVWCERYQKQLLLIREAFQHHAGHPENLSAPENKLSPDAMERIKRELSDKM